LAKSAPSFPSFSISVALISAFIFLSVLPVSYLLPRLRSSPFSSMDTRGRVGRLAVIVLYSFLISTFLSPVFQPDLSLFLRLSRPSLPLSPVFPKTLPKILSVFPKTYLSSLKNGLFTGFPKTCPFPKNLMIFPKTSPDFTFWEFSRGDEGDWRGCCSSSLCAFQAVSEFSPRLLLNIILFSSNTWIYPSSGGLSCLSGAVWMALGAVFPPSPFFSLSADWPIRKEPASSIRYRLLRVKFKDKTFNFQVVQPVL